MKRARCPKCGAELPRRGRFCLECGCDLYAEGLRRPPLPVVSFAVVLFVIAALVALGLLASRKAEGTAEERLVRANTEELLKLAAEKKFEEIVRKFYMPNSAEFQAVDSTLREIVRGSGAPGLNVFRASVMDDLQEASKFVERYQTPHHGYVVGVLAAICFPDGALHTTLGGTLVGAQRAETFLAWHLGLAFLGLEPQKAQITAIRADQAPDGSPMFVVSVQCPGERQAPAGVIDPAELRWVQVGRGRWALTFGHTFHLDEVLDLLRRVKF